MTLTYFSARSNLERWTFLWEKAKTMDILEILQPKLLDADN